jgi:hypothetical protein
MYDMINADRSSAITSHNHHTQYPVNNYQSPVPVNYFQLPIINYHLQITNQIEKQHHGFKKPDTTIIFTIFQ